MSRYLVFLAVGMVTLSLGCDRVALSSGEDHEQPSHFSSIGEKNNPRLSDAQSEFAGVQVAEVMRQKSKSFLKVMGKVLAPKPRTAIVSHAFAGRVAEIHVCIGDWVKKGQPLITLESHEVGTAKCDFYKAKADLELAQLNFEREKHLMEQEIGVQKNLVSADAALKIALSNMEAAEKTLHVLGFTEEQVQETAERHQISPQITLFAPIDGTIVTNEAVQGALYDASVELLKIIDTTVLWVDAEVYEKDIAIVRLGQKVEIAVPAYPEEVFHGEVSFISSVVNEETRTITVRAEVANPDAYLKPGMFADVKILLNGESKTLVIPHEAILQDGNSKIVFVQVGDAYERREIKVGSIDGAHWQIISGLQEGEKVVVQGNYQLRSVLLNEVLQAAHTH
ncbi:MAG: efflux RND transporter periplasmic adaptor subunit [Pirellulales bacterium]|nr:efflux RND transporter periplasmic adaptor subunit [Pirellulales bacterium]